MIAEVRFRVAAVARPVVERGAGRHVVSVFALAASALAWAPAAAEEAADEETAIVVTGTLIRGSREDAPAPVDVIDAGELAAQGSPTMLELTKRLAVSAGVIGDAEAWNVSAGAE